jgi:hypothetical protein
MTWRDTLSNLVKKPATHWFYESIPPKNTSMEDVVSPIEPNKAYVRVKLIQMYLGLRRIWTMNRMPVVHAFPRFLQSQGTVDVPVIIAPNRLKDLDGSHTERVVSLNQTVFGPVPKPTPTNSSICLVLLAKLCPMLN